jgi:DNA-binding transcriptional MerR regulator
MRYRVEQVAAACDVSVDTVRYYQSRGLVPPPVREGRVAVYDDEHLAAIRRIRDLQRKGLSLAAIARVLGEGSGDEDLAAAVAAERGDGDRAAADLTLNDFAEASGVPASLIQAVEREGITIGRIGPDGEVRYAAGDITLMRTALKVLEFGLPLSDLLSLARDTDTAMRALAARSVDLFDEHVRRPILDTAGEGPEAEAQTVEAFRELLDAVTALVSGHFRRVVLDQAEERMRS